MGTKRRDTGRRAAPNATRKGSRFRMARSVGVGAMVASLIAASLCVAQGGEPASEQHLGPLAKVVEPYIENREIAGAVMLVANRDRVIDRETIGFADLANRTPMRPNDLFWIASMSKAMTVAAVMMLVDEGKISINDPVEKYLPEFKNQMVRVASKGDDAAAALEPASHPITIREILSHTAGLPFKSSRENGALDLLPLKTAVESYAADPLIYQPGTKYSYSNEGINTAGRIVEVVSGMRFQDFLEQRLFKPLGMKDTTFWPSGEQLKRLAKSYDSGSLREVQVDQLTYPLDDRARRYPIAR